MPRFGKRVLISPSQEGILEAISGWEEDARAGGIFDETPNEPASGENCSQRSLERVFDVSGSSLCSETSQQAVQLVSPTDMTRRPRTTSKVSLHEREEVEDSYNEAFESDRSQSPPRTVSWSLSAAAHGCNDGPKSSIISTRGNVVALQEVEISPLTANLKLASETDVPNRSIATPAEAVDVTSRMKGEVEMELELEQAGTEAEDAVDESGRRTAVPTVCEASVGGGEEEANVTADGEVQRHLACVGTDRVSPRGLSSFQGSLALKPCSPVGEDFGSGSSLTLRRLGRKEEHSQNDSKPALSGKRYRALEEETSAHSTDKYVLLVNDNLDQIATSVQVNEVQVTDELEMAKDDQLGKKEKSRDKCEQKKPRDSLLSPTPPKSLMEAPNFLSEDEAGLVRADTGATERGGQCSPLSGTRPPRAVQEKLDRLRSQSRIKRAKSKGFNLLEERLTTERDMVSADTVLDTVKFRSGERPATNVTAADLLKTALDVPATGDYTTKNRVTPSSSAPHQTPDLSSVIPSWLVSSRRFFLDHARGSFLQSVCWK